MKRRFIAIFTAALAGAAAIEGQSVISTLLGGAPDNVVALTATIAMPVGVVTDASGDVYASLQTTNQVIKIDSSGKAFVVAGNGAAGSTGDGGPARSATLYSPAGLALDSQGSLYIADSKNNRIRRVSADGVISTYAGTGTGGNSGDGGLAVKANLKTPLAIAFDANGNLLIADSGNSNIRLVKLDGTITTIAGTGKRDYGGDGGLANVAGLDTPAGLAVDSSGNYYISDTGNHSVRIITSDGMINRFAGYNKAGYAGDGSFAENAYLNTPTGLTFDRAGYLYILDYGNDRIRRVSPDDRITTYAGTGTRNAGGDGGLAKNASMNVQGIWADAHNDLFLADGANNRVRKITAADGIIDTIAGNGLSSYLPRALAISGDTIYFSDADAQRVRTFNVTTGVTGLAAGDGQGAYAGDGSAAVNASLRSPRGITFDSSGRMYIADSANHRVRRINTDATITTVAGTGTAGSDGDGAAATSATINEPADVAVDSSGNLYIAERSGQRIRKVNGSGVISTVAGTGTQGAPTSATNATDQPLSFPSGLLMESSGSLLIADTGNHRILRLTSSGSVATVAGTGVGGYSGDGKAATAAQLNNPMGMALDAAGNLYIADSGNNAVRQIGTDGVVATVAGLTGTTTAARTGGFNGDGSPATAYSLNQPNSVVPGANCSLYIADTSNKRIRRLLLGTDYTLNTNPAGLQLLVDGQAMATPAVVNWLAGSTHRLDAPTSLSASSGVKYLASAGQDVSVSCGAARASVTVWLNVQYQLTVVADTGGTVSSQGGWQTPGTALTLTASANAGYAFTGWSGDCSGAGACQLTMDSPKTVRAQFTATGGGPKPAVATGGVISASAFGALKTIAPGGWFEIYGANLSTVTAQWQSSDFKGDTAPQTLQGVSVTVAGKNAYVSYVSPGQINAQAPDGIGTGAVQVVVSNLNGSSDPVTVTAADRAAGLLTPFGNGYLAAFQGGTIVGSPGYTAVKPGDVITIYGTGFGTVTPAVAPGQVAAALNTLMNTVEIRVGGVAAALSYQGLSPGLVGLYQFNATVPQVADGDQTVTFSTGGVTASQTAVLTVKR
ncbi:MAG: SMP-30/gluconolactonase/LRE family protein [Acidobacteria bacterium]|nr:SMP-30/gluconolactonase/LRE family protein [Acidobacteriota bacterium]